MIKLTEDLIRKHRAIVEATVRGYSRRSKKGKYYTVAQYERQAGQLHQAIKRVQAQAQDTAYQSTHGSSGSTSKHERLRKSLKRLRDKLDQVNREYAKRQVFVYATDPDSPQRMPRMGRQGGFRIP